MSDVITALIRGLKSGALPDEHVRRLTTRVEWATRCLFGIKVSEDVPPESAREPLADLLAEILAAAPTTPGRFERALLDRQTYQPGLTITETDVAHARHMDGCGICQSASKSHAWLRRDHDRLGRACASLVMAAHELAEGSALPAAERTRLKRAVAAAGRIQHAPADADLQDAINPARDLEHMAAYDEDQRQRQAAQQRLDLLRDLQMTPEGLRCGRCGALFVGTTGGRITDLYRTAVDHVSGRRGCAPDEQAGGEAP